MKLRRERAGRTAVVEVEDKAVVEARMRVDKARKILELAMNLGYVSRKDDNRVPPADEIGGLPLLDENIMSTLRAIGKEYLKELFGRIFSGNFNLTTISFPIKCMRPLSLLETFGRGGCTNPLYLNKAALTRDPLEKIKYIITCQISTFHVTSHFLKPVP